jgi:lauroyl/myristoyl acyltransferase/acyl carrier protein
VIHQPSNERQCRGNNIQVMEIPPQLKEYLDDNRGSLPPVTDPDEPLQLDSLGLVRLVAFLEWDFGYRVKDEELTAKNFETVRAIGQLLATKTPTAGTRQPERPANEGLNGKNGHTPMASAKTGPVVRLKLSAAWLSFYLLRFCERLLPKSLLSLLLWPPAAIFDLVQLPKRKLISCWRRFPQSWRPKAWRFFLRQSLGLYHSQIIYAWPDRLCSASWLRRCSLEGASNLIDSQKGDRPVVLASLHFGPSELLPYWLRAHGIVTTTVRAGPPDSLKSLTDYQHALSPPADVPVFVFVEDLIPLPRFSRVSKILGPGRRLLVMVDPARGRQIDVPFEDRLFRMPTGAIRLAQMTDAELIPCLITETATWKFKIHFGTPVPRQYIANSADMQPIATHLLKEFSKVISRYPEQCKMRLLSAMSPLPGSAG